MSERLPRVTVARMDAVSRAARRYLAGDWEDEDTDAAAYMLACDPYFVRAMVGEIKGLRREVRRLRRARGWASVWKRSAKAGRRRVGESRQAVGSFYRALMVTRARLQRLRAPVGPEPVGPGEAIGPFPRGWMNH